LIRRVIAVRLRLRRFVSKLPPPRDDVPFLFIRVLKLRQRSVSSVAIMRGSLL
jgi:hypothetical protein